MNKFLESKVTLIFLGVFCLILLIAITIYHSNKPTILEVGIFAGSNWDVANADSYLVIDKVVARFEEEHPGVKVQYVSGIRKEDYSEWYAQKLLEGKAPDVAMVLSEDFNRLAFLHVLVDLDEMMDSDQDFERDQYYSTAIESGLYKGDQYALPYEVVPQLMCVNRTLLEQEGFDMSSIEWSWDEFYEISNQITRDTDGDDVIDQFGVCNYTWKEAANSNGSHLFNDDGTVSYIADETVMEAIRFTSQLLDLNQEQTVTQEDFNAGKVAFMPLSYAEYRTYKRYPYRIKKYSNFKWDVTTLPAGSQGDNTSEVESLLMGISSSSKQKDLAWELLKLFTYDEEIQLEIFNSSQGASVLKSVINSKQSQEILQEDLDVNEKSIDSALLGTIIEQGIVMPKFQKYDEAMVFIDSGIQSIINEKKDINSSIKILQRDINKFLIQ
ncbi:MAG TPA: extracellular solute-binding protein [Candidatus Merdenecus merdavium]|nr:extracellular solute-binding protein [Candidatus Merdenecus merdavium]